MPRTAHVLIPFIFFLSGVSALIFETLFDLLSQRQRERIARGWPETPIWIFCSETGTRPEPRNVERVWARLRRRAQKKGVRAFPLTQPAIRGRRGRFRLARTYGGSRTNLAMPTLLRR
jgi:hypothetical protein